MNTALRHQLTRLDRALPGIQIITALEPVVLVSGAFREQRSKRLEVTRNVLRAEPRRQAPIEKARSGMRRPIQALRVGRERLVFSCKMGAQFD